MGPSWGPADAGGAGGSGGSSGGGSAGGASAGGGAPTAAPGAAAGSVPGRRGGMALDLRRGKTSRDRLQIDWTFPVWKPKTPDAPGDGHTVVVEREHALPLEQAYELITDGDRRPLLVLRECDLCKGSDHALLSRKMDNEQTALLTHWFRCVKLPPNVLDGKHPFHNLFAPGAEGERIPHLFFCSYDGSNKVELPGDQPQSELWAVMFAILERDYQGNAKKAVKDLRALLSQYDKVDALEQDVGARLDRAIDKHGPDSSQARKLQHDLDELQQEREELVAKEQKLRALALVEHAAAPAGGGNDPR